MLVIVQLYQVPEKVQNIKRNYNKLLLYQISGFLDNAALVSSLWTMAMSSVDRYYFVTHPFTYFKVCNLYVLFSKFLNINRIQRFLCLQNL